MKAMIIAGSVVLATMLGSAAQAQDAWPGKPCG